MEKNVSSCDEAKSCSTFFFFFYQQRFLKLQEEMRLPVDQRSSSEDLDIEKLLAEDKVRNEERGKEHKRQYEERLKAQTWGSVIFTNFILSTWITLWLGLCVVTKCNELDIMISHLSVFCSTNCIHLFTSLYHNFEPNLRLNFRVKSY